MCGIGSIIRRNKIVTSFEMKKLMDPIHHRGPDNQGIFTQSNVGIANCRLSIVNQEEISNQPFLRDGFVLTFNGEIYNYRELRNILESLGYTFKTNSDTEVIICSYQEWGQDCVKKFSGMWAFILYDTQKSLLFCSRDRFGEKPFYYFAGEEVLAISSEPRQLKLALGLNQASTESLAKYLCLGVTDDNELSFYEGINCLKPGQNMIVNLNSFEVSITEYYSVSNQTEEISDEQEFLFELDSLFKSKIIEMATVNVPMGLSLSSGIDSSLLLIYLSDLAKKGKINNFTAFTASTGDIQNDEGPKARWLADRHNVPIVTVEKYHLEEIVYEMASKFDQPVTNPSVAMQYHLMCQAGGQGIRVMFDGQGADETWLGYQRYLALYLNSLNSSSKRAALRSYSTKGQFLELLLLSLYFRSKFGAKLLIDRRTLNIKPYITNHRAVNDYISKSRRSLSVEELRLTEISGQQLKHLLRYGDMSSMMNSIELRLPFLNHEIVEFSLKVNPRILLKNGFTKYPLRKLIDSKDPNFNPWNRKKIGYETHSSFLSDFKPNMIKVILDSPISDLLISKSKIYGMNNLLLWRLFNISIWFEAQNMRI